MREEEEEEEEEDEDEDEEEEEDEGRPRGRGANRTGPPMASQASLPGLTTQFASQCSKFDF